jgi:glycosyltransferase involved in cell wall biosynthesis
VIASDAEGAFAVRSVPREVGVRLVWHFHHNPEDTSRSWSATLANRYVHRNARLPDLITNCDASRARIYAREAGIDPKSILVVANCTRPIVKVPEPTLRHHLAKVLPDNARIIMYHGAVGSGHSLKVAVRSIPRWPANSVFVLKGRAKPDYSNALQELARRTGVAQRLILYDPGFQSYDDHYADIAGADVGWTVFEPDSKNHKYQAMGSNKRFECMALGVPQIGDDNPGASEFIEGQGFGLCIPYNSAEAAGAAVSRLLGDEALRKQMAQRCRELHLSTYNYDRQFEPVVEAFRRF